MTTREFLGHLRSHPDHRISFVTPDGAAVPAHLHIEEDEEEMVHGVL